MSGQQRTPPSANDRLSEEDKRQQAEFVAKLQSYIINVQFPPQVKGGSTKPTTEVAANDESGGVERSAASKPCRTSDEIVSHKLLESGVLFEDLQSLNEVTMKATTFVEDMKKTGCYDSVQVLLNRVKTADSSKDEKPSEPPLCSMDVVLGEKRWYKLYVGAGIRQEDLLPSKGSSLASSFSSSSSQGTFLPRIQFETSLNLLNVTGHTDNTKGSVAVDRHSTATIEIAHQRPLYSMLPPFSPLYNWVLTTDWLKGSATNVQLRATMDTVDYDTVRSCKEGEKVLGVRISNLPNTTPLHMAETPTNILDWTLTLRDLIPRRSPDALPYRLDASPEIVAQSGPCIKHSISYNFRSNNAWCDDRVMPTNGTDVLAGVEIAGPPGDVGFLKGSGGMAFHLPLLGIVGGPALHASISGGLVTPLTFGGLYNSVTAVSDRFFLGGPPYLRGFLPGGIGPRAEAGGSGSPGGDALGGDMFYAASIAASVPVVSSRQMAGVIRLLAFGNAGTLTSLNGVRLDEVLKSSRLSAGVGVAIRAGGIGRLELTYAVPFRYGPRDARRNLQLGFGFTLG